MHFLRKIFTFSNAKAGEIPLISGTDKSGKIDLPKSLAGSQSLLDILEAVVD